MKSFCQSTENNKNPILGVLRPLLAGRRRVLEIGSGTGQHAAHFALAMPHLVWQTSDLPGNHASIAAWIEGIENARAPIALDVDADDWPAGRYDAAFSANTAHIMPWPSVERMFAGVARVLEPGGAFALYGPFNYGGTHTSEGNARFDAELRATDSGMGIRDAEAVFALAEREGMRLVDDHAMPANNRTLVFARS